MIKIAFKNILDRYRFNIQTIHKATGINRTTLTALYYERTQRIDLDTLDRLCLFFNGYFDCQISDIIKFTDNWKRLNSQIKPFTCYLFVYLLTCWCRKLYFLFIQLYLGSWILLFLWGFLFGLQTIYLYPLWLWILRPS